MVAAVATLSRSKYAVEGYAPNGGQFTETVAGVGRGVISNGVWSHAFPTAATGPRRKNAFRPICSRYFIIPNPLSPLQLSAIVFP